MGMPVPKDAVTNETVRYLAKSPAQLTETELEVWVSIYETNPALYSPYFHVDYTRLVGELRDDIQVIIAYQHDQPIAFYPFKAADLRALSVLRLRITMV